MTPFLKSITITNFRSIKGTINIPLDAPVVLIHGQNGTGKTSILSAIELALTREVPSLHRLDGDYLSHLIHKDFNEAVVSVKAGEKSEDNKPSEIRVKQAKVTGSCLLSREQSTFFSERCYLAQATLSRLLELYQGREKKNDSQLTKFVKDLLGLDHLDALIDGLDEAGNVTRIRAALPAFRKAHEDIPLINSIIQDRLADLGEVTNELSQINDRVRQSMALLGYDALHADPTPELLAPLISSQGEEKELQALASIRRDLIAANNAWSAAQESAAGAERGAIERALSDANSELHKWRQSGGGDLASTFALLRDYFVDLPDPFSIGPEKARRTAVDLVAKELGRCSDLLMRDAEASKRLEAMDLDLKRAQARAVVLDQQISGHASEAGSLAQALAGILPHANTEECPVCGRNFSEISPQPLRTHISQHISALTESAGRLQVFTRERADAAKLIGSAERERGVVAGRQLESEQRNELKLRQARLEELQRSLVELGSIAVAGEQLISAASATSRQLAAFRTNDQESSTLRETLQQFAVRLEVTPLGESESFESAVERFHSKAIEQEQAFTLKQSAKRSIATEQKAQEPFRRRRQEIEQDLKEQRAELERLVSVVEELDKRNIRARDLAKTAKSVRTEIVRRVFNDSLNAVWRELFIRLAPHEPFVPAFALPDKENGIVEAVLETHYRNGGKGGDPRAMLSAGNLNTAALTLFLALHLSVKPSLQCLVIDDPVQSMDEVHIAQFAALLRTLSKQKDRQVIVAVHEKPLFDYLALELSPAFRGDSLITVELNHGPDGETIPDVDVIIWEPDIAFEAA
jgi:exonuclease SbcC